MFSSPPVSPSGSSSGSDRESPVPFHQPFRWPSANSPGREIVAPEVLVIEPGVTVTVRTDISECLAYGTCGQLAVTDHLAERGVILLGGLVQSNSHAPLTVILHNLSSQTVRVSKRWPIAHFIVLKLAVTNLAGDESGQKWSA